MDERRHTMQLIQYWKKIKSDSPIPVIESFESHLINNHWFNQMIIFGASEFKSQNYHIEYIGQEISNLIKHRIIGKNESNFTPISKIMNNIIYIAKKASTIVDQGEFSDIEGNTHKYRSCLLPFGQAKEHITHFVMYLSYLE